MAARTVIASGIGRGVWLGTTNSPLTRSAETQSPSGAFRTAVSRVTLRRWARFRSSALKSAQLRPPSPGRTIATPCPPTPCPSPEGEGSSLWSLSQRRGELFGLCVRRATDRYSGVRLTSQLSRIFGLTVGQTFLSAVEIARRRLPHRAPVHPAQGNALGKLDQSNRFVGPTGESFGERLARWAERFADQPRSPGRCPGLGERLGLWPTGIVCGTVDSDPISARCLACVISGYCSRTCTCSASTRTRPITIRYWVLLRGRIRRCG